MNILICEDNVLLALDLEYQVGLLGHTVLGRYTTSTAALDRARQAAPDVALVDLTLADGRTGPRLIAELRGMGIPSIVISGELRHHTEPLEALCTLEKPVSDMELRTALARVAN